MKREDQEKHEEYEDEWDFPAQDIIELPREDGQVDSFEVYARFTLEDNGFHYMVLIPYEEEETEEKPEETIAMFVFRYEETEDGYSLFTPESEEEMRLVEEAFEQLMQQADEEEMLEIEIEPKK